MGREWGYDIVGRVRPEGGEGKKEEWMGERLGQAAVHNSARELQRG